MARTLVEKVLARACGLASVAPGQVVFPRPDLVVSVDIGTPSLLDEVAAMGAAGVAHPERVVVVADHDVPHLTPAMAERSARTRQLCRHHGLRLYDQGRAGNSHILPAEEGLVGPGSFVLSADTHSGNLGALGAVAPAVLEDMATVLALGTTWVQVPETVVVELGGRLRPGVHVRDVADHVLALLGPEAADGRAVELAGPWVGGLGVDGRMVLCNRPVEVGAEVAVVPPDEVSIGYARRRGFTGPGPARTDPGAPVALRLQVDVGTVEPQVAVPPSPDHVVPLSAVAGTPVTHALVQGCSSGTFDELAQAAEVLAGRQVHPDVRLVVVPMTQEVYRRAGEAGLLATFARAGATVMAPSCQACYGASTPLVDGDVCIATSPRNDPGRMGSRRADIYLAGPATVAASAVAGRITAPADVLAAPAP